MDNNTRKIVEDFLSSLDNRDYISPKDLPGIDLYMDQVTTYMDNHLKSFKRYEEDKVLTKTMINNYAKNNLLPPPIKKKYSKEHMLLLTFIYHFKGLLSISDIQKLLQPITQHYYRDSETFDGSISLEEVYMEIFSQEHVQSDSLKDNLFQNLEVSQNSFAELPEGEQDFLQTFTFICCLCYDVCLKKQLIERLIDAMPEEPKKGSDKTAKASEKVAKSNEKAAKAKDKMAESNEKSSKTKDSTVQSNKKSSKEKNNAIEANDDSATESNE